jgi:hypothetical protein
MTDQSDKLPISTDPSFVSGRLGHQRHHKDQLQTQAYLAANPRPGSLQINLLFTIFAEQACASSKRCKLLFLQKTTSPPPQTKQSFARPKAGADRSAARPERSIRRMRQRQDKNGGAERDRTADPLLAKQVLSQLSYSPNPL